MFARSHSAKTGTSSCMTHRIGRLRRLDIAAVSVKALPMENVSCERGLGIALTVDATVTTVDSATGPVVPRGDQSLLASTCAGSTQIRIAPRSIPTVDPYWLKYAAFSVALVLMGMIGITVGHQYKLCIHGTRGSMSVAVLVSTWPSPNNTLSVPPRCRGSTSLSQKKMPIAAGPTTSAIGLFYSVATILLPYVVNRLMLPFTP